MFAIMIINGAGDMKEWARTDSRSKVKSLIARIPGSGWELATVLKWNDQAGCWTYAAIESTK